MRVLGRVAVIVILVLATGLGFAWWYDHTGQHSDPGFNAREYRRRPTLPNVGNRHPKMLIDEAHRNFHTASGRYEPFADLLQNDGYIVSSNQQPFSAEMLKNVDVLVIADALGPGEHETRPAFTPDEETALVEWVRTGGSLFLISDHTPFGSAVARLAKQFGVIMHLRFARDDQFHEGDGTTNAWFFRVKMGCWHRTHDH